MRLSGFGWVHSMNSPLRWCLCLVLVCLICLAATGSTAAASATGPLPKIERFTADPMVLEDGQAALYKFVVKGAENMRVIEGGNTIYEINSPSSATLKGTVNGMPPSATRTGDTLNAVLIASNRNGEVEETLTLRYATELPKTTSLIPPVSDEGKKSHWLEQTLSQAPLTQSTAPAMTHQEPEFFECPSSCNYCLEPGEAAGLGFTQKCSEERCYYSPDNDRNWYCYKETEGYCCKEGRAGQAGQVTQATKTQCAQAGGSWYATQAQAQQACQPVGWCCRGGYIAQTTKDQCSQAGGSYWSTNQAQVMQACQPPCWCCAGGKVGQIPQAQCAQMGGACYADQHQAIERCQPAPVTYWCCRNGQVYPTTTPGAGCYATQAEAIRACQQPGPTTPPTYLK